MVHNRADALERLCGFEFHFRGRRALLASRHSLPPRANSRHAIKPPAGNLNLRGFQVNRPVAWGEAESRIFICTKQFSPASVTRAGLHSRAALPKMERRKRTSEASDENFTRRGAAGG